MGRAGHADLHVFWRARDVVIGRDKTNSLFSGEEGGRWRKDSICWSRTFSAEGKGGREDRFAGNRIISSLCVFCAWHAAR